MILGLGTGSAGTAELARVLGLPHEKHWLPWRVDLEALDAALPAVREAGGEVNLSWLPYVEALLHREPKARIVVSQRDFGLTVRGLSRKLGTRNPFSVPEDAAAFHHGFPYYGSGLWLREAVGRFYREFYARAYDLQARYPWAVQVFFTDHLLGDPRATHLSNPADAVRWADLCESTQTRLRAHVGARAQRQEIAA